MSGLLEGWLPDDAAMIGTTKLVDRYIVSGMKPADEITAVTNTNGSPLHCAAYKHAISHIMTNAKSFIKK